MGTASLLPVLLLGQTVELTGPANGSIFLTGHPLERPILTAEIVGSMPDLAYVEFTTNAVRLVKDNRVQTFYSYTWSDAPPGLYDLQAVARDANDQLLAISPVASIEVRDAFVLSGPIDGAYLPETDPSIIYGRFFGDASVIDRVEFVITGPSSMQVQANDNFAPTYYSHSWENTPGWDYLQPGTYSIHAIALDGSNTVRFVSNTNTVTVLPAPRILSPTVLPIVYLDDLSVIPDFTVSFSAPPNDHGGGVSNVQFGQVSEVPGILTGQTTTNGIPVYTWKWPDAPVAGQDYNLQATCVYSNGVQVHSQPLGISIVDRSSPILASPPDCSIWEHGDQIPFEVTVANTNGIQAVQINGITGYNDDTELEVMIESAPFTTNLLVRSHKVWQPFIARVYVHWEDGSTSQVDHIELLVINPNEIGEPVESCFLGLAHRLADCLHNQGSAPAARMAVENQGISLPMFHAFRELMRTTTEGAERVGSYEEHTRELILITASHPAVMNASLKLLQDYQPALNALLSGNGGSVTNTPEMVGQVAAFFDLVYPLAGTTLQAAIDAERMDSNNFSNYVGRTIAETSGMLGLTVPDSPWIVVYESRVQAGDLADVEVNYSPDLDYSLWQSADLLNWSHVPNAVQTVDGYSLRFEATVGEGFLQVRAQAAAP